MEVDAPFKITLEIDQDDVFDYEECKFADKVTIDYIKEKFLAEVKLIHELKHTYKHLNTSWSHHPQLWWFSNFCNFP